MLLLTCRFVWWDIYWVKMGENGFICIHTPIYTPNIPINPHTYPKRYQNTKDYKIICYSIALSQAQC